MDSIFKMIVVHIYIKQHMYYNILLSFFLSLALCYSHQGLLNCSAIEPRRNLLCVSMQLSVVTLATVGAALAALLGAAFDPQELNPSSLYTSRG